MRVHPLTVLVVTLVTLVTAAPQSENRQRWQPTGKRDLSSLRHILPQRPQEGFSSPQRSELPKFRKGSKSFSEVCGQENPNGVDDRIVGGHDAHRHQWPWQVALFMDGWFCGGSLISDEWVLTAAHCADTATYFEVMAGVHDLMDWNEPHRIKIVSKEGYVHPDWDRPTLSNDIALVKLPEKIPFSQYVRPACLPPISDAEADYVGVLSTAIGWGFNSDDASGTTPILQMVSDLPIISREDCQERYDDFTIHEGIICINSTGGRGICHGDSGSPLHKRLDDGEDRWYQVGIASFVDGSGCEAGVPHGFTRVAMHLEWIETITGIILV